jgi:glutathione S-transferase
MKLYSDIEGTAPSPRRVRVFLVEKSFELEIVRLKIHKENRSDDFAKKNPMRNLPVLELNDGTCISETVAICRYIEALQAEPFLFGSNDLECAIIEMWNRRSEFAFYMPIEFAGGFLGEEVARNARKRVQRTAAIFDAQLTTSKFLASNSLSIADITTKVALDFGIRYNDIEIDRKMSNFLRWNEEMEKRESLSA